MLARSPRRRAARGFTLIEMVIVVVLLSILGAMALPRINVAQYRMDAAARLVRTTLQQAQRLAITRQGDVIVSFDLPRGMVRVAEDANGDGLVGAAERTTWKSLEDGARFQAPPAGLSGAAGGAIVGPQLATVDGFQSLTFRRDGAASSDAEVYLTSARGAAKDFRAVSVVQSTGRTDWYRYLSGAWKLGGL